jgi:hypothetical protein
MSAGPGIANATGTRIESASKHHIAVRVDFEHMLSWVGYDQTVLQKEKMKWCMHKDDLVIGCSRPVRQNEPQRSSVKNKAYPSVVVTLAKMEAPALNYLVAMYHNCRTFRERDNFIVSVERSMDRWAGRSGGTEVAKKQIQEMPEFYFLGVGVGVAYAHPNSGDNVASALFGGFVTIMNGAFPVMGGDMMQWYWDAETPCFQSSGHRWPDLITGSQGQPTSDDVGSWLVSHHSDPSRQEEKRRKFYDRGNGNFAPPMYDGNVTGKQQIAYPKPFRYQDDDERIADRLRVFGRALSSARPFEMMDVMVCRQSM